MNHSSAIGMQSNIELHPKCVGCDKVTELGQCIMYHEPTKQWSKLPLSSCPGKPKDTTDEKKSGYMDPIKASKRGIKQ